MIVRNLILRALVAQANRLCIIPLLALCACSSARQLEPQVSTPSTPAAAPVGIVLPAPLDLLGRRASEYEPWASFGRERLAADYDPNLPHSAVLADGSDLLFQPSGAPGLGGAAYAGFRFSLPPALDWANCLVRDEDLPPTCQIFYALSNWQAGRWDWMKELPSGMDNTAPYRAADGTVLLFILTVGNGELRVHSLELRDALGNTWMRGWHTPLDESIDGFEPQQLLLDSDFNLLVCGTAGAYNQTQTRAAVIKYGPSGDLLFQRAFSCAQGSLGLLKAAIGPSNELYLICVLNYTDNLQPAVCVWLKLDPGGNLLDSLLLDDGSGQLVANSLCVDQLGQVHLLGVDFLDVFDGNLSYLQLSDSGEVQRSWRGRISSGGEPRRFDDFELCAGSGEGAAAFVSGRISSQQLQNDGLAVLALDEHGALLWTRNLKGAGQGFASQCVDDAAGGVCIASMSGYVGDFGTNETQLLFTRLDSSGDLLFCREYGDPARAIDERPMELSRLGGTLTLSCYSDHTWDPEDGTSYSRLLEYDLQGGLQECYRWSDSSCRIWSAIRGRYYTLSYLLPLNRTFSGRWIESDEIDAAFEPDVETLELETQELELDLTDIAVTASYPQGLLDQQPGKSGRGFALGADFGYLPNPN